MYSDNLDEIRQQIEKRTKEFSSYVNERDGNKMASLYKEDGMVLGFMGKILGRENIRVHFLEAAPTVVTFNMVVKYVYELGDKIYSLGVAFESYKEDGKEIPFDRNFIMIWEKVDGEWMLVAELAAPMPNWYQRELF